MPSVEQTDNNTRITTLFFLISAWDFKSPKRELRGWTYGLTFLSEKMQRSNHLQMLQQRQHLLSYFKTLSGGPADTQS